MKIYPNKTAFYAERDGRWSGESDFGVWHVDDIGIAGPPVGRKLEGKEDDPLPGTIMFDADASGRYTVSVVADTGDVYCWRDDDKPLAVIAQLPTGKAYALAEELLEGWAEIQKGKGMGRPISWFITRLVDYLVTEE